jgi:hypothetical protein
MPIADVNSVRLQEYQLLPEVERWRRHVRPFAVRVGFAILAMGLWCLSVVLGLGLLESAVVAMIVFALGWYLSSLEPTQAVDLRRGVFPRIVELDGDNLRIRLSSGEEQSLSLRDSCWFLGLTSDDPMLNAGQARQSAVIIVLPDGRQIACGIRAEYIEKWIEGLRRAACPRVMRFGGVVGAAVVFMFGITFITGLVGGILVGTWVGLQLGLPNGLLLGICRASGAVLGAFSASITWMFIPGLYRPTAAPQSSLCRFAGLLPAVIVVSRFKWVGLPIWASILFWLAWSGVLLPLTASLTSWRNTMLRNKAAYEASIPD